MTDIYTATAPQIPRPAEWLGYFFGHDLHFLHAETLMMQHIPDSVIKREAELMRTKWFDYRRMHPTKATYYFAHCFHKAYQEFMVTTYDRRGRYMKAFKQLDVMHAYEKLSVWRLRQLCDSLGMRYDFFLPRAFRWYSHDGWFLKRVDKKIAAPRPSHINANADLITDVMMQWEEECATRIQFAKDPRYKTRNFFGHADQVAWENWLIEQIKQRRHPQYALHAALYIEDSLRIERAVEEFDLRVVRAAIDEALTSVSQH
jgi:hypothetical protein